jgi:hypothetical protein
MGLRHGSGGEHTRASITAQIACRAPANESGPRRASPARPSSSRLARFSPRRERTRSATSFRRATNERFQRTLIVSDGSTAGCPSHVAGRPVWRVKPTVGSGWRPGGPQPSCVGTTSTPAPGHEPPDTGVTEFAPKRSSAQTTSPAKAGPTAAPNDHSAQRSA